MFELKRYQIKTLDTLRAYLTTARYKGAKAAYEDMKKATKAVDEKHKSIRDRLDALRDRTRAPLDAWEEAEESRKQKHRDTFARVLAKREANKQHVTKINTEAAASLSVAVPTLEADVAMKIIQAIAEGKVTNVTINY